VLPPGIKSYKLKRITICFEARREQGRSLSCYRLLQLSATAATNNINPVKGMNHAGGDQSGRTYRVNEAFELSSLWQRRLTSKPLHSSQKIYMKHRRPKWISVKNSL